MANLPDLVTKAFYFGVGLVSYAGEQAGDKLPELQRRTWQLAEEMVKRGEMTAEEAAKWVNERVAQDAPSADPATAERTPPQTIEILNGDESEPLH